MTTTYAIDNAKQPHNFYLSDNRKLDLYLACAIAEQFDEGVNYTSLKDVLLAWSFIGFHGHYKTLQGFYGRTLANLVRAGYLTENFDINHEFIDSLPDVA